MALVHGVDKKIKGAIMTKKQKAEYDKKYRRLNDYKIREYAKEYREKNKDKRRQYEQQYREENKGKIQQYLKDNKDKFRLARRIYGRFRYKTDSRYRLDASIARQIRYSIKKAKDTLWISLDDDRGYTCGQLKAAFEKLFLPGMSWENYGTYWQVDHIIPRAKFHYSSPDINFGRCWALSNLRPLPAKENMNKSNKPLFT